MLVIVNNADAPLQYVETICNFFYHLKYRHIGESIKEKFYMVMPNLKPQLRKRFKYIISDFNQQSS